MRYGTMFRNAGRFVLPLAVCLGAAAGAGWLLWVSPGLAGLHGMAEAREYAIAPLEAGRLSTQEVTLGQRVRQGQVLARLDASTLLQEIRVAEAEQRAMGAEVAAEDRTLDLSGLEADHNFQVDLEKAQTELGQAENDEALRQAERKALEAEISRQAELVQRHLVSGDRLQELRLKQAALQDATAAGRARIEALQARRQAVLARSENWRSVRAPGSRNGGKATQLQPLLIQQARQRENLQLLRLRLENLVMRSPVDGTVARVEARTGDVLAAGAPVMTVVEDRPCQVIAYLEEDRGWAVETGDRVTLRPRDRTGAARPGTVDAVSGTVAMLPQRFWPAPSRPRWGRQVFIHVDDRCPPHPGEAFDVLLNRGTDEGQAGSFHPALHQAAANLRFACGGASAESGSRSSARGED